MKYVIATLGLGLVVGTAQFLMQGEDRLQKVYEAPTVEEMRLFLDVEVGENEALFGHYSNGVAFMELGKDGQLKERHEIVNGSLVQTYPFKMPPLPASVRIQTY